MRKSYLLPAYLFLGLLACNDGGSKAEKLPEEKDSATVESMHMHAAPDSAQLSTELPAIPVGARVFFVNLKDGQTVTSPFTVQMGVEGISLDSAGTIRQASGHHHILIDVGDSMPAGVVVPKDNQHLHFGNAQAEAELTLPAGQHRITLQYADGIHRSYGSPLSATVMINVE